MSDNIGEVGVRSIRLQGKKLGDLPPHQSAVAMLQLPAAIKAELQQKVDNVLKTYPRQTREYVEARITECKQGIADFIRVKKETQERIKRMTLLAQEQKGASFRDIEQELYEIGQRTDLDFETKRAMIAERRAECAEYDPKAIAQQVTQYQENIERLDDAIQQENDSIAELTALLARIDLRDAELKALGVTKIQ